MAYVAVDRDGTEFIYSHLPERWNGVCWSVPEYLFGHEISLPPGTIRKLIGRDLTWSDDPVELTEEMMKTPQH